MISTHRRRMEEEDREGGITRGTFRRLEEEKEQRSSDPWITESERWRERKNRVVKKMNKEK